MKNVFTTHEASSQTIKLICDNDETDNIALETLMYFEELSLQLNMNHYKSAHCACYENVLEIIVEGFGDFLKSCKDFFGRMVDKIKDIFNRFIMFIRAYITNFDNFLKKYKNELLKKNPEFEIEGFTYSFTSGIPNTSFIFDIVSDYNREVQEVPKKGMEYVVSLRNEFGSKIFYNQVRGKCLGRNSEITEENYHVETKKAYRFGKTDKSTISVNSSVLKSCIDNYTEHKKIVDEIIKEKNNIISFLEHLQNFFRDGTETYYEGERKVLSVNRIQKDDEYGTSTERHNTEFDRTVFNNLNSFYDFKFHQARELSSIAILALNSKIEALREALTLYKTIIRKSAFGKGGDT